MTKPAKEVVTDPISTDLKKAMRQLKLSPILDTLPDRLALARQQHLSHAAFLELVLADEATRRDTSSAARRARVAGLDPAMRLDTWDEDAAVRYDRSLWTDLTSLRFLDAAHGAVVLGAVGVGKTHLATALGHIAVRRRVPTLMLRADAMFKRLRASRLDNSTEAEMRRLAQIRMLIIDDFALQPLDATATADFYELVVARHQRNATIVTSNRGPDEWLTVMTDAMLAEVISTSIAGFVVSSGGFCPGHCLRRDKQRLPLVGNSPGGCLVLLACWWMRRYAAWSRFASGAPTADLPVPGRPARTMRPGPGMWVL